VYSEKLLEHFRNPRNAGELPAPALSVEASNPACGDVLRLSARLEGGVVVEARYQARGCTASVAAGSAVTEWMAGKTKQQLNGITAATLEEALGGLAAESRHAAVLSVDAVRALAARIE
jgi:nitrogen fixation NifU-like protein